MEKRSWKYSLHDACVLIVWNPYAHAQITSNINIFNEILYTVWQRLEVYKKQGKSFFLRLLFEEHHVLCVHRIKVNVEIINNSHVHVVARFISLLFLFSVDVLQLLHFHEIVEELYFHSNLSVCLSVWVYVCVSVSSACEQSSSQTDEPIWTRFSLNGCLLH